MATDPSPFSANSYPDSIGADDLSIAVIGRDETRRSAAVVALAVLGGKVTEVFRVPAALDGCPRMLDQRFTSSLSIWTAIRICIGTGGEHWRQWVVDSDGVLQLSDPELLVQCTGRGGAEFLSLPLSSSVVAKASVYALRRENRSRSRRRSRWAGLLTFMGSKGGAAQPLRVQFCRGAGQGNG